ncbi:MAG: hypothetical protein QF464_06585, partial [Myxococcota bacterium]|nr:hypothetical protein [Myxococcota bacterium]
MLALSLPAQATVPLQVPTQGVLRDNAGIPVLQGAFEMTFSIYGVGLDDTALWTETWTSDGDGCAVEPSGCVHVTAGAFRVNLGAVEPLSPALFASGGALWLGVSVEGEPELPWRPLGTTPFAFHAESASGLACSGCVAPGHLSEAAMAQVVGDALDAVADAGYHLGPLVVTEESLPAGGLDEVSNGTMSNEHTEVFASTAPLAIPDYFPPGIASEIVVPSMGTARALRVHVELHNSDLSTVQVVLHDPLGESHVLWDGNGEGDHLVLTVPPDAPVTGDLGVWAGLDPAGAWQLEVIDDGFFNDGIDGQVDSWSIEVDLLSGDRVMVAGALLVDGEVAASGSVVVGDSGAPCDASRA